VTTHTAAVPRVNEATAVLEEAVAEGSLTATQDARAAEVLDTLARVRVRAGLPAPARVIAAAPEVPPPSISRDSLRLM
jgi:hypothetical protein